MLGFLSAFIGFTLKILGLVLAVNVVIFIVKGGKETMRDLRDTALMAIKVLIQKSQNWLYTKYKEPQKEEKGA